MKLKTIMSLIAVLAMASAGVAAQEIHSKMVIALKSDGDGEVVKLNLDSEAMGFDLHELQEGENRAFVDEDGRNVLITREADGIRIDVDGESITLPTIGVDHDVLAWTADGDVDVDVEFIHAGDHPPGSEMTDEKRHIKVIRKKVEKELEE